MSKVYIGAVIPKDANSFKWEFNLCQDGKCVNATSGSTYGIHLGCKRGTPGFGPGLYPPGTAPAKNTENYEISELNVVDVIIKQGWSLEKPLRAEMTESSRQCSNVYWNLPAPVLIIKIQNPYKEKVILNPNEDRSCYGDLLDKYHSVDGRKVTMTPNSEE